MTEMTNEQLLSLADLMVEQGSTFETPKYFSRLVELARIGASVMPRPLAAAPPASPAPVDGERVRAAKIEAFDEALSIAEGSYSYGEQQNEIIAGIRAALAAINGEK